MQGLTVGKDIEKQKACLLQKILNWAIDQLSTQTSKVKSTQTSAEEVHNILVSHKIHANEHYSVLFLIQNGVEIIKSLTSIKINAY